MQNDCCGFDLNEGYKNYFKEGETANDAKIPNSCCGKYNVNTLLFTGNRGDCKFEDYSKKKGCGDLLAKGVYDVLVPPGAQKFFMAALVICYIIQILAAVGSFYVFYVSKNEGTQTGTAFSGTVYR